MTLPPTQNQNPGWLPPQPQNNPNSVQDVQPSVVNPGNQIPEQQYASSVPQFQPAAQPAQSLNVSPNKKTIKGPLILLGVMIVVFAIITAVVLLTSQSSKKTNPTIINSAQSQQNTYESSPTTATVQPVDTKIDGDSSEQPYKFIDNKQKSNLQNLQNSVTTSKSQNIKRKLPPATPEGWQSLKTESITDPVTTKPYLFTSGKSPAVGEVQYLTQSVCSSQNEIIPSTDTASFALKARLYSGVYYCVDSSNE